MISWPDMMWTKEVTGRVSSHNSEKISYRYSIIYTHRRSVIDMETFSVRRGARCSTSLQARLFGVYNTVDRTPRPHHSHRRLPRRIHRSATTTDIVNRYCSCRRCCPSPIFRRCCCHCRRYCLKSRPPFAWTNSSVKWTWVTYLQLQGRSMICICWFSFFLSPIVFFFIFWLSYSSYGVRYIYYTYCILNSRMHCMVCLQPKTLL